MEQILQPPSENAKISIKSGQIKRIVHHPAGYLYGFITPDDRSADIYFGENQVDTALLPSLNEGLYVTAEVEMTGRGRRACRVWH